MFLKVFQKAGRRARSLSYENLEEPFKSSNAPIETDAHKHLDEIQIRQGATDGFTGPAVSSVGKRVGVNRRHELCTNLLREGEHVVERHLVLVERLRFETPVTSSGIELLNTQKK